MLKATACGDNKIADELTAYFDQIKCMAGVSRCLNPALALTSLHLGMASFAMLAARNRIDTYHALANSDGTQKYKATSYADTEGYAERQASGFGRSKSYSQSRFNRAGESHDKSYSVSHDLQRGAGYNKTSDVGQRRTVGAFDSYQDSFSRGYGTGTGESKYESMVKSSDTARTGPGALDVVTPQPESVASHMGTDVMNMIRAVPQHTGVFTSDFNTPINFAFQDATNIMWQNVNTPDRIAEAVGDNCDLVIAGWIGQQAAIALGYDIPADAIETICQAKPSAGAGSYGTVRRTYNWMSSANSSNPANYQRALSINGALEVGATVGGSWRRDETCSGGSSYVKTDTSTRLDYDQGNVSTFRGQDNQTVHGYTFNLADDCGGQESRSSASLHSESRGESTSCGESHTNSVAAGHTESQTTQRAEVETERHAESEGESVTKTKARSRLRKYNQVFQNLNALVKMLQAREDEQRLQVAASLGWSTTCPSKLSSPPPIQWYLQKGCCERHLVPACTICTKGGANAGTRSAVCGCGK